MGMTTCNRTTVLFTAKMLYGYKDIIIAYDFERNHWKTMMETQQHTADGTCLFFLQNKHGKM